MSSVTNVTQTRNQLHTTYNVSKVFLGENERIVGTRTPGADETLANGLILAQVSATRAIVPLDVAGTDGSQFPIGLLDLGISESITILNGVATVLNLVNKGRVNESKVTLPGSLTLNSIIVGDGRTVRQFMNALGIIFEGGTELTTVDNS